MPSSLRVHFTHFLSDWNNISLEGWTLSHMPGNNWNVEILILLLSHTHTHTHTHTHSLTHAHTLTYTHTHHTHSHTHIHTTLLTGHGNIKAYLYRLGLTDNRMCPCEEEEETVDHLIFKCKKLRNQSKEMIRQIKNTGGNWPATSETLINNYKNFFVKFVKFIELSDLKWLLIKS